MPYNFNMRIADLDVSVQSKYKFTYDLCNQYISENGGDVIAAATEEEIKKETLLVPGTIPEYAESICIYRNLADKLPLLDRIVFHGAVITYNDDAYLFTAPSGTGKTTHIKLWRQYLGKCVDIVNGDKPILHITDTVTAYGTPWCGKEGFQKNRKATLKGICVITRGTDNKTERLSGDKALEYIMRQVYFPNEPQAVLKTLSLIDKLIKTVPCFICSVDMSENAVKSTFEALTNKKYGE